MKLYTADYAPNPRRVSLFLAAYNVQPADLGIELVYIDLAAGENTQPAYLAINPLGLLPALVLETGQVIADSTAICRYIASILPVKASHAAHMPALFGKGVLQQVQIEERSRQAELEIMFPLMYAFQLSHPFWADKKEQLPAIAPLLLKRAATKFSFFNDLLASQQFLVNNTLSVADITLYVALDFGRLAGLRVDHAHPHLLAFYERMKSRFSAVKK